MKRSSHAIAETAIPEEDDIDSAPVAPDTVLVSDAYESMLKVGFRKPDCEHDSLVVFYVMIDHRPESPGFGERQSLKLDASNSRDWGTWITTNLTDVESGFNYKVWVEVYNGDQMARSNHSIGNTMIEEEDDDRVASRESSLEATPAS